MLSANVHEFLHLPLWTPRELMQTMDMVLFRSMDKHYIRGKVSSRHKIGHGAGAYELLWQSTVGPIKANILSHFIRPSRLGEEPARIGC